MYLIGNTLIPAFNTFLQRVPDTNRVRAALRLAQTAIDQIEVGFNSFPNFELLPADTSDFPHGRYGSELRKYAGPSVIGVLISLANSYYGKTGKKLFIGDMNYEHGGKWEFTNPIEQV